MNKLLETRIFNLLQEKFGEPISEGIGQMPSTVGVPDKRDEIDELDEIDEAGSMATTRVVRPLGELEEARKKRKGPSKKTAKKILKGTKTFKDKVKKVSGWAKDPEAAAAWMMHKATGKWPSEK